MERKRCMVIVVAEGCTDTLVSSDAGGQKASDVGPWLKQSIEERFKSVKKGLTIKYIDPTYMIRAVPPSAFDSVYCNVLAQNAVHGVMAGYTRFSVGRVDMHYVLLPIELITDTPPRKVDSS